MEAIRKSAREKMKGYCKVCPVCNGKACAGEVPGMGGLGTGSAFHANLEALDSVRFNMKLVHGVKAPITHTEFLGLSLSMPLLAAPIGGVSFNMGGGDVTEGAYIDAIVAGCKAKGLIGCTGDGVPEIIHASGNAAIEKAGGHGIPFIKPWEEKEFFDKLEKAEATGATVFGVDIDAAGLVTLAKMGRPVSPMTVADLEQVMKATSMKFILKGVMTVHDALCAKEAGAEAIVVSNHGGRVLDSTPGTAEVLPEIAEAVGSEMTVLVDGGIRSGGDILKMLALGAHGVMIGRPFSVAAVGGLQQGVETYIDTLRTQLLQAMVLTGTDDVNRVESGILR
ncbi:alpha-hydroxy-acid oxidizing protein [Desulfoluna butyratoxydans]|uniref:Fmn-dependent dehydrogenase n=1 Tax=Desulfoluna butyratoxydans TaxID=231438 RepID=A0A4U8YKR5_9BACT|nr:alpha-hydroxy-acid oxidizing protein [Desulfoluna butyratoxydans]VFQ43729.1 fmn-dependent dehydrogenase [Desulfoluna butyratoxydans]